MPYDRALADVRVAARGFALITALFGVLGLALVGIHGFSGMHAAAEAAPAVTVETAAPAAPTTVPPQVTATVPAEPLVVEVVMDEFSYRPRRVQVPAGQPVLFDVVNVGKVDHELLIGDEHVQE